ncbi:MAG: lysoplasmalogenase [Blastocatellia bacterium]
MNFDALTFGRLRGFGATDRMLLAVSIVSSAIYFITAGWPHMPGRVVFKALSIAPLALLAFRLLREGAHGKELLRDHDNTILAVALACSCVGDVLLDLDPDGLFVQGLMAFLTAHFIYILLFVRNWSRPLRPGGGQLLLAAVVLLFSLILANWFAPSLGTFAKPVMLYVCVITVMVVTAVLARFSTWWIVAGAILFLVSDSLIAVHKFKMPVPWRDYLVWATYYLGQYGIAIGFLREKLGAR